MRYDDNIDKGTRSLDFYLIFKQKPHNECKTASPIKQSIVKQYKLLLFSILKFTQHYIKSLSEERNNSLFLYKYV